MKFKVQRKWKVADDSPTEEHITIDNEIWQVLETPNGFVKLLNAYLDTRQNRTVVRVNVNSVPINASMILCQFWFDEKSAPLIVQPSEIGKMISEFLLSFLKKMSKLITFQKNMIPAWKIHISSNVLWKASKHFQFQCRWHQSLVTTRRIT